MGKGFLLPSLCLLACFMLMVVPRQAHAKPPAIFILGDSTADVGTNNFLEGSKARANFPYYGIDFPKGRPTGRFSNGLNSADFLAKLMGYRRSPRPFFSLGGLANYYLKRPAFRGVNFASAGSGLLDETGSTLVKPLLLFGVQQQHKNSSTLYRLGARKFGIISVPPIGCCPSIRLLNETGGCLESLNGFAIAFHSELDSLFSSISSELQGMKYSLGNAYQMTIDVIQNPYPFNFTNVDTACCGFGKLNAEQACNATANLCSNRRNYLFWDLFHPTQSAAQLAAQTLFGGPPRYVTPINFSQLAEE